MLFTQKAESEADLAALEILARTGVNPEAVLRYISNPTASLDTSEARIGVVRNAIGRIHVGTYGPDDKPAVRGVESAVQPNFE